MNKRVKAGTVFFFLLSMTLFLSTMNAEDVKSSALSKQTKTLQISSEQKAKYPLKSYHAILSLQCIYCHEGQEKDVSEFEDPEETACLSCHKNKEYLAERLAFMDTLKANPHNSVHDGKNLSCDECHHEHQPSENMCAQCHEKEIKTNIWMRKVP